MKISGLGQSTTDGGPRYTGNKALDVTNRSKGFEHHQGVTDIILLYTNVSNRIAHFRILPSSSVSCRHPQQSNLSISPVCECLQTVEILWDHTSLGKSRGSLLIVLMFELGIVWSRTQFSSALCSNCIFNGKHIPDRLKDGIPNSLW
jgi:hypothetical protein